MTKFITGQIQRRISICVRGFALIAALWVLAGALSCAPVSSLPGPSVLESTSAGEYERLLQQGRTLAQERHHRQAIVLFEQAGGLLPGGTDWQYEIAAARFAMDRFGEAEHTARTLLERAPEHDAAYSLWWMARLVRGKKGPEVREAVRQEINTMLDASGRRPQALFSACITHAFMDSRIEAQQILLELAASLPPDDPDLKEAVARSLFEEIITEKTDMEMKLRLMESYLDHFPHRRFAGYIAFQWLAEKQRFSNTPVDPRELLTRFNPPGVNSRQIRTGAARWLVDEDRLPEMAVELLLNSLDSAGTAGDEKPPGFDDALWRRQVQLQIDERLYLLGRAWFSLGQSDRAESALSRAAAGIQPRGEVYYYLGRIAEIKEDPIGAIACYRRALGTGCTDADPLPFLSALMETDGDPAPCFAAAEGEISFSDVTVDAGLSGQSAQHAAWGDYNMDGLPDLLLDGHRLFRNTGEGNFRDATEVAGLSGFAGVDGGIFGDCDNDGDLDLFVFSANENLLLENRDHVFVQVHEAMFSGNPRNTAAAAWGDLNNDGFLDLYAANYENFSVTRGTGIQDQLYLNDGSGGFADISRNAGIETDEAMCGRGVTWTDYNADGRLDIVVANYRLDPNFLWVNRGDLPLSEQSGPTGVRGYIKDGYFGHSIGPVSGDLDNDGNMDLFITNLAHPRYIEFSDQDMLLVNREAPDCRFEDRYLGSGISFEETNADPALADVDNDGDLDLYITSIYPGRKSHLYANQLIHPFADITWVSGTRVENSWGCAFADFNDDGFPDLLVTGKENVRLFKNNGNGHHWLKVRIDDSACNRFGIGGRVTLTVPAGRQVREITAGRGAGSQDDLAVIFGLGDYFGPGRVEYRSLCGNTITAAFDRPDQTLVLDQ